MSISLQWINNTLGQAVAVREQSLKATISSVGDNPTSGQMMRVNQEIQEWTMFMELQNTAVKAVIDAYRDAVRKAG